jgi:hypothetical protein
VTSTPRRILTFVLVGLLVAGVVIGIFVAAGRRFIDGLTPGGSTAIYSALATAYRNAAAAQAADPSGTTRSC